MIEAGLSRGVINKRNRPDQGTFSGRWPRSWCRPPSNHGLQAVPGYVRRSKARETEPVRPYPTSTFAASCRSSARHVAAMVMLQRLSGMRAGEIVLMRPAHGTPRTDRRIYEPPTRRAMQQGRIRTIFAGPHAAEPLSMTIAAQVRADERQDDRDVEVGYGTHGSVSRALERPNVSLATA